MRYCECNPGTFSTTGSYRRPCYGGPSYGPPPELVMLLRAGSPSLPPFCMLPSSVIAWMSA